MNITDVRVRKVEKEGKMKAVVSITIDEEFVVHDIKVIEGEKGLFIAMPSRKANDGEYRDIAHPINSTTRDNIQQMILSKYKSEIENELKGSCDCFVGDIGSSDFVSKMSIALKETSETKYWLRLLNATEYLTDKQFSSMYADCSELEKLLVSILKSCKSD